MNIHHSCFKWYLNPITYLSEPEELANSLTGQKEKKTKGAKTVARASDKKLQFNAVQIVLRSILLAFDFTIVVKKKWKLIFILKPLLVFYWIQRILNLCYPCTLHSSRIFEISTPPWLWRYTVKMQFSRSEGREIMPWPSWHSWAQLTDNLASANG